MKKSVAYIFFLAMILSTGFRSDQGENVEFSCMKMQKSTNTCHFNFTVDGAKYRYVDIGCKFSKKKDEAIKKTTVWQMYVGESGSGDRDKWYRYTHDNANPFDEGFFHRIQIAM